MIKIRCTRQGKIILLALLTVVLLSTVVLADNIKLFVIQTQVQTYFNNWDDNPYLENIHDCSDMSTECEKYFETELGYDCYLVYGDTGAGTDNWVSHLWNIVLVDGKYYEFESTSLWFKPVSQEYDIHFMQQGFYIDGIKYETCQNFMNDSIWMNIKELL